MNSAYLIYTPLPGGRDGPDIERHSLLFLPATVLPLPTHARLIAVVERMNAEEGFGLTLSDPPAELALLSCSHRLSQGNTQDGAEQ